MHTLHIYVEMKCHMYIIGNYTGNYPSYSVCIHNCQHVSIELYWKKEISNLSIYKPVTKETPGVIAL